MLLALAAALAVGGITRAGQPIANAPDVAVRALDGTMIAQGVHTGETLPDDVQVSVPPGERVELGDATGRVTLDGATDTLHFTGRFVSVSTLTPGRTEIVDLSDRFRFFGPGFELAVSGGCTVDLSQNGATVTRESGTLTADLLGSTAFVRRVDVLTAARSSIAYEFGEPTSANVTLDEDEAAAAAGQANGEFNLGTRYYWGDGVRADAAQALHWLQAAAAQRFAEAENSIGYAYAYGSGGARYMPLAQHWLLLAAADGSAAAADTLGDMSNEGHGVPQSYTQALHWYEVSAAQGDADAENDIGLLDEEGHTSYFAGAQPQYRTALQCFRIAAAQGNADAENDVGYMYEWGHGVAIDYAQALRWYRLSAAQRDAGAEYNLGVMYERGYGVPQDNEQAISWYRLAAAQGIAAATAALARLERGSAHPGGPIERLALRLGDLFLHEREVHEPNERR